MTEIDLNNEQCLTAVLIKKALKSSDGGFVGTKVVYESFRSLKIKAVYNYVTGKITLTQLTEEQAQKTNEHGFWYFGG